MQQLGDRLVLSPTDLVGFLHCCHLTRLDTQTAVGKRSRPPRTDGELDVLGRRGGQHEQRVLAKFQQAGLNVDEIPNTGHGAVDLEQAALATRRAMHAGADVIYQATFLNEQWQGRADFLIRVDAPSSLGSFSYEPADAKLARRTRVGALLQLCTYAEQVDRIQGLAPRHLHVLLGNGEHEKFETDDFSAYNRHAKRRLERFVASELDVYPNKINHCEICRWQEHCDVLRRGDDHLSLVARMTVGQIHRLNQAGIGTVNALAQCEPTQSVRGIGSSTLTRHVAQARLQVNERNTGKRTFELLEPSGPRRGLQLLACPSAGDLFFDMEGDPFEGEYGIEYLFGAVEVDLGTGDLGTGDLGTGDMDTGVYRSWWAHDSHVEQQAFEQFVDYVMARLAQYPDMHIYHYAPYETSALKRLMSHYGTRETEIDLLLRGRVFVDLYQVVRQGLLVSAESYSIKQLEPFYMAHRQTEVVSGAESIVHYERWLETDDQSILDDIEKYNEDDCVSTFLLRQWLEARRGEAESQFGSLDRPGSESNLPSEAQQQVDAETDVLFAQLVDGVADQAEERSSEQQAQWLLAYMLAWHRRESKPDWWAYFSRIDLTDEELLDDREALSGLSYLGEVERIKQSIVHRYQFDVAQEFKIGLHKNVVDPRTAKPCGEVMAVDDVLGLIDLKRAASSTAPHPTSVIPDSPITAPQQAKAMRRIAEAVCLSGVDGSGPYRAIRDLLLRRPPRLQGGVVYRGDVDVDGTLVARQTAVVLDHGCFAVQGPPGAGKTYTGSQLMLDLVAQGRTVGVTASSHKVIANLLSQVISCAHERGMTPRILQKISNDDEACSALDDQHVTTSNKVIEDALRAGDVDIVAGTPFLFCRAEFDSCFDALVVDEAGQLSLANVCAVGTAAKNLVLLGDPQQLAQPSRGIHPPGTGRSALAHLLADHATMPLDLGVFLAKTRRMHPDVCGFISERFYEGRLTSIDKCANQRVHGDDGWSGAGLRFVPVSHSGNRNASAEEAACVLKIVDSLLGRHWTDSEGELKSITRADVLVVAPYNAHVAKLSSMLPPGVRVGTVDKFQGQEAVATIYSLAASSPHDVPRGMEFLFSPNRLNVAISRARVLSVVVASPRLLDAQCRSPRQLRMANALCRYVEIAEIAENSRLKGSPRVTKGSRGG